MPKFLITRNVRAAAPGAFGAVGLRTEGRVIEAESAPEGATLVPDATEPFDWKPLSAAEVHALIYPAPADEE